MLTLDETCLVGRGAHRECHRHPEDGNLCIKIVVFGDGSESRREKQYYRHLNRRQISWDMIPRFHGDVETNLGRGSVFDLILDSDGKVSKSLRYYLSSKAELRAHHEDLSRALYALKNYLLDQRIITMRLKPKNIACKKMKSGSFRLFVIDNIGNSDFIPICNHSRFMARKKILRKWSGLEERILHRYKHNIKMLQRIIRS